MRLFNLFSIVLLVVLGIGALVSRLSPDAVSMGIGIFFGAMASIPAALLVRAASRRRDEDREERGPRQRGHGYGDASYANYQQSMPQAPVIVLTQPAGNYSQTGQGYGGQGGYGGQAGGYPSHLLPPPDSPPERQFRVIGEE
jgi:hypothetical protein